MTIKLALSSSFLMAQGRWFKDNGTFEMDFYGDAEIIIFNRKLHYATRSFLHLDNGIFHPFHSNLEVNAV